MPERIKNLTSIPAELAARREPLLVSIYLPTHRYSPENEQDRIRFRNLVSQVEKQLEAIGPKREYPALIANLNAVETDLDRQVWRHAKDGLAVLASEDAVYVRKLSYPVDDIAVVSDRFVIKPLIRDFQYNCRCLLLAVSKDRFDVYATDGCTLEKLEMPKGVGNTLQEVFDDFDNHSSVNAGSYGGPEPRFHGHGSKSEVIDKETIKFFHYANDVFVEHFSRESDAPVILVALPQYQSDFRDITTIPGLTEQGIEKTPVSLQEAELLSDACSILKELQDTAIDKILENYGLYQSRGRATSDPREIAHALMQRTVSTLFVEEDAIIPGSMDESTGAVSHEDPEEGDEDLADQFTRLTFAGGGDVYSLAKDRMPAEAGAAALLIA